MPFSKSVPLSRLISFLTCSIPAKWIRLVCLVIFFAVVLSSLPVHLKYDGASAQCSGPRRTQGPPSRDLPNLDDVRGREPGTPKIMPPVPATKCRGRDEKCKKAKGKISSNLPGNQDRLLAYADYRSKRDYAGWLKIAIPALSVLDDLIYGSARMISDFPDMSYRSHGDVLTKSTVKLANTRDLSTGSTVKGANTRNSTTLPLVTTNSQDPCFPNVPADHWRGAIYGVDSSLYVVRDDGTGFLNVNFGTGSPTDGIPCGPLFGMIGDYFTANWTRTVNFAPGIYRFTLTVDEGAQLYVDGQLIIDGWSPATYMADVFLSAGNHNIGLEYFEFLGSAMISLSWADTGCIVNVPTDQWKGEYFNNTNLTGVPKMVRNDGAGFLNFNWGGGSPGSACGVNADNFSARWTRTVNFASGTYRFTATADDGVRLYVDGQLTAINNWAGPPNTYTADVALTAGNHEIKMEFAEYWGGAAASLSWAAVCQANVSTDQWKGEYFNNINLTAPPVMVRNDGAGFLDFNWGDGSPGSACGVNADNFSARWTRTVNFASGTYRFTATADDGVRLYVDGQLTAINNWAGPPNTYTADVALTAGNHEIKMEFAEYGGWASASLSWATSPVGDLSMALIDPNNRIGSPDKDLLSRNCNWSLPLLGLPGRAGLDLGLVLSLNSLIYTRAGSVIHFDPDQGDLGPGFKLGFPEIRNAFFNTDAGAQSYLLSMPSGSRVEFRQISTNVYEAVDSSYMLLTHDPLNSVFVLRTTDGTQFRFEDVTGLGDYKCKQIKDRQGNFITITYNSQAEITTITDTLDRRIYFNYDTFNHLISITQDWGGQTHTWATFAYGTQTIQTNFPGLTLSGTTNGAQESVLLRVGLADGTVYSFEYNTYAQVKKFRRYAPNNSNPVSFPGDYFERAYTTYGLPDNATNPQTDCPRATSRTDWAYDWNPGVTYVYAADPGRTWGQVTFPDGTIYKEFFATTGWQRGLTTQTENWAGGVREKWTTLQWTQDNTGVSYKLNPRVTETIVHDKAGNRRRTKMDYTSFGLVSRITEYGADSTTVLRLTETEYNLSAVYTDRRIIGLPSAVYLKDGNNTLFSKITNYYDLGGEFLAHQGPPIQHDTANYGSGFVQGRGHLNRTRRWDVTDPNNPSKASENEIGYNTSGSVIFARDPLDQQASVSYDDSFSDGQTRNTFAYPTRTTDPDTFSSTIQYNYYFGAVTRTQNPKDAAVTRTYDAAGRIERITNAVNGAYTRYVYAPDQRFVVTFTTINDLNPANEFYSNTFVDGHDRPRATASDHPTSVGQYKVQYNVYDVMGRLAQQFNPTEIYANGQPAGDDAAAGWVGTSQAYDWQGRPTISTNQDGTTKEVIYGGCGCAGGQVVVTRDEVGRRQKMTYDILGRLKTKQTLFIQSKNEPLDGNGPAYLTTTNTCNVRDQVTNINVMDNATGASENTMMTYDGHGRLATRKYPIESAANTFVYNPDDTLQTMTDPRGVTNTYGYNNRKLVTSITYGAGPDVIPLNPVTFAYDEVGNRLWMDDQPGRVDYHYNALSQMEWEERRFDDRAQPYRLSYEYNLAGQLKKLTDPWNGSITYTLNKAGEATAATGNATGQVYGNFDTYNNQLITQFAANVKYRAWGGLKSFTNGDTAGSNFALSYNTRKSLTRFEAGGIVTEHSYYPDGRVKDVIDWYHRPPLTLVNFDRHYAYDHVGRLTNATAGDGTPYSLTYSYDSWDRTKSRTGSYWANAVQAFNPNYDASGRDTAMAYDAAGNVTDTLEAAPPIPRLGYDAAGRQAITKWPNGGGLVNSTQQEGYDGDGLHVRRAFDSLLPPPPTPGTRTYSIRSSVLGGKVVANLAGGADIITWAVYIYLNGEQIASQAQYVLGGVTHKSVVWWYKEPVIGSLLTRDRKIQMNPITHVIELYTSVSDSLSDPTGGWLDPHGQVERPPVTLEWPGSELNSIGDFSGGCHVMGLRTPCDRAMREVNSGAAIVESIDPWFGLTPGVGPSGVIPVWSLDRWREIGAHEETPYARGLVFAFGPQDQRNYLQEDVDNAVKGAISRLTDPRCASAVAGKAVDSDPLEVLNHLHNNFGISIHKPDTSHRAPFVILEPNSNAIGYTKGVGEGKNAHIYVTNLFFTPGYAGETIRVDNTAVTLSFRNAQVLTILHELSHAVGDNIHGDPGRFFDRALAKVIGAKQAIKQEILDERIYMGCFAMPLPKNVGD